MSFNSSVLKFIRNVDHTYLGTLKDWISSLNHDRFNLDKDFYIQFYCDGTHKIAALSEQEYKENYNSRDFLVKIPKDLDGLCPESFLSVIFDETVSTIKQQSN